MSKIGTGELLVILVIALLIFGPEKLPELGKVIGKTVGSLKHHMNSVTDDLDLLDSKPTKKTAKSAKSVEPKPEPELEATEPVMAKDGKEEANG